MVIGGNYDLPVPIWIGWIIILLVSIFICCLIDTGVIPDIPKPHLALIGIIFPSFILGWHTCAFLKYGESRRLNLNYTPPGILNRPIAAMQGYPQYPQQPFR